MPNSKFILTVFAVAVIYTCLLSTPTMAATPPAWYWNVPETHTWKKLNAGAIIKRSRPLYSMTTIHGTSYMVKDPDGFLVMTYDWTVSYVDWNKFMQQHTIVDSRRYDHVDYQAWYQLKNKSTGKTFKLVQWKPSAVPQQIR